MRTLLALSSSLLKVSLAGLACIIFLSFSVLTVGLFLKVDNPVEQSDAIIVLLGGQGPERILKAEELYRQNVAPKIIFGTGFRDERIFSDVPKNLIWPPSGDSYLNALLSLGVSSEAIEQVETTKAYDTGRELEAIANYLRNSQRGYQKVSLVSSASHSRRVSIVWSRVAPDIPASTHSAKAPGFDRFFKSSYQIRSVLYEIGALLKEFLVRIRLFFL